MTLKQYQNLSGKSGVRSYSDQKGSLTVRFSDNSRYQYTNASSGQYAMRRMRQLARRGVGLNAYINRSVGKRYSKKF